MSRGNVITFEVLQIYATEDEEAKFLAEWAKVKKEVIVRGVKDGINNDSCVYTFVRCISSVPYQEQDNG